MSRNGVLVVGSANMDMVVATARFPHPGETVFGGRFGMFPGGKGANQAVACAKLGMRTEFIAKMGNDVFRDTLMASMRRDGVRLKHVMFERGESTGIALITVDRKGQNEILVVSGSNMRLTPADLERHRALFHTVQVVLLQLEIPLPSVVRAAELARQSGAIVILNPAPARKLPKTLLKMIDFLTPNETETELLTGVRVHSTEGAGRGARALLRSGVKHVIVTLGNRGCLLATTTTTTVFPARRVKPVDTTAAGDAFNGALAYGLACGEDLRAAIPFANAVAAFAVTRMGAQSSMPTMKELRAFVH